MSFVGNVNAMTCSSQINTFSDEYDVPSPPMAGLRGARNANNASNRTASDLFTNTNFASATSPNRTMKNIPGAANNSSETAESKALNSSILITSSSGDKNGSGRDGKEGAQGQKRKPCNCKNSKCLKLYCDCFAMKMYCDGCNCRDCHNNEAHKAVRDEAIKATLDKNPNAFQAKITRDNAGSEHSSGCHCKKSKCLKKYCECFEAAVYCSEKCKCLDCENYEGSVALAQRKAKIRDGRKITQPFSKARGAGAENPAITTVRLESQLNGEVSNISPGIVGRQGVATRQSTRSTRSVYKADSAFSPPRSNELAAAASRRRPDNVSPVAYILSCCSDTEALVISIFHFLTDTDLYNASLVSKAWLKTAFDQALWEYDDVNDGLAEAVSLNSVENGDTAGILVGPVL